MKHGTTFAQITQAASLSCRFFGNCSGVHVTHSDGCSGQPCTCAPEVSVRGPDMLILIDRRGREVKKREADTSLPKWATNEVACRGEPLARVLWQNEQWAVTEYGLECRDGLYVIEKSRLNEGDWRCHMHQKCWVVPRLFDEALTFARRIHVG